MRTYESLRPGNIVRDLVVRAVEVCGSITDVQFYDDAPDVWHTFASTDPA